MDRRWMPLLVAVVLAASSPRVASAEPEAVGFLWLREYAPKFANYMQGYAERLAAVLAKRNGWGRAKGVYASTRADAERAIAELKPRFAVLNLAAFLGMRGPHQLAAIGTVEMRATAASGRRFYVVSSSAQDLAGCRGQPLASMHAGDARFVDQVVARGAFAIADFKLVPTTEVLEWFRLLARGKATCALVDSTDWDGITGVSGGDKLRELWKSEPLLQFVVVAFPSATVAERRKVTANLAAICTGADKQACLDIHAERFVPGDKPLAPYLEAYAR
jgi:hypothetical protein